MYPRLAEVHATLSADPKHIGARLRAERLARRMSVDALAQALRDAASERDRRSMPKLQDLRRTIRGHEAGERPPGPRYRMLYAAVFGIDEAELFGDVRPVRRPSPVPGVALDDLITPDEQERLTLAARRPARVDAAAAESLSTTWRRSAVQRTPSARRR